MSVAEVRRSFMKRALAAGGGLTSLVYFAEGAWAADCKAETRLLGFGASLIDGVQSYNLSINNWRLGDCELRKVLIVFRGQVGNFQGEVATHFTHGKDIWHFRLELFTGNPSQASSQVILFDQNWDGPRMSELDRPLFHQWQFTFPISPAVDLSKVYGRATSCC